jgi:NADPH2:quinone reductase
MTSPAAAFPRTMRAARCVAHGRDVPLTCEQLPRPAAGEGEVLIRVEACGLNVADDLMRAGRYQVRLTPPFTPGLEVAGAIAAVGPGTTGFGLGDPVVATVDGGGLADYAIARASSTFPRPATMDAVTAAAVLVSYGTADIALTRRARLQPDETVVVFGAGGVLGQATIALARAKGAKVIAVARSAEARERAVAAGAQLCLDSGTVGLLDSVLDATGGRGAEVVVDPVGDPGFDTVLRTAGFNGRVLTVGFAGGAIPRVPLNLLLVKNLNLMGVFWGGHVAMEPDIVRTSVTAIFSEITAGSLPVPGIDAYSLPDAQAAMDRLQESNGRKIVVEIR